MAKGPENRFRDKELRPRLNQFPRCYYFIKEALALRGIPDIIGVCSGKFFALEVKASRQCANAKTGRIVLQKHFIEKINRCGGFGAIVHPENIDEVLERLYIFCVLNNDPANEPSCE